MNLEDKVDAVRKSMMHDSIGLLVDHQDMMGRLTKYVSDTYGKDFGLVHVINLLQCSIEDMKEFYSDM